MLRNKSFEVNFSQISTSWGSKSHLRYFIWEWIVDLQTKYTTFCMKEADENATYILKQLLKGGEGEKFFVGGQIENMELSNF